MTETKQDLMNAVVQDVYGDAEVLRRARVPVQTPGDDEVLIRVVAASVSQGDVHLMTGRPYLLRLALGFGGPKAKTRGMDVAGVVERVGSAVTTRAVGDEVFGVCRGAFADYAVARASKIAIKPEGVSFEQAAAVPVSGSAALKGLRDAGSIVAGQRVLITGAGGGVGTFAVQIAKHYGAHVTAVCSGAKVAAVSALGADAVIDYTREDFTASGQRWDLIFDAAGHRSLRDLRAALTAQGRLVLVGSETGEPVLGGFDRTIRAGVVSPFVGQALVGLMSSEETADLQVLGELMESGAVVPQIDRVLPMAEVAVAMRLIQTRGVTGKVVVAN